MTELRPIGDAIWLAGGPIVDVAGFAYPTRMAVMRLGDGGLYLWSPIARTEDLAQTVDALGPVRFIATPTAMHDRFLMEWKHACPGATLLAAPGSRKRAPNVAFDAELRDAPEADWAKDIDQVLMRGNAIAEEVIVFHRRSGVVLIADLIQQFPRGWFKGWRALAAQLDGMTAAEPRVPQKFRMAFHDRKAARAALSSVLEWPAQKVVLAHGPVIEHDAQKFLKRAFAFLG